MTRIPFDINPINFTPEIPAKPLCSSPLYSPTLVPALSLLHLENGDALLTGLPAPCPCSPRGSQGSLQNIHLAMTPSRAETYGAPMAFRLGPCILPPQSPPSPLLLAPWGPPYSSALAHHAPQPSILHAFFPLPGPCFPTHSSSSCGPPFFFFF